MNQKQQTFNPVYMPQCPDNGATKEGEEMSIEDKIKNAQHSSWLTDGIPKWKVRLIIWWAKVKARLRKRR